MVGFIQVDTGASCLFDDCDFWDGDCGLIIRSLRKENPSLTTPNRHVVIYHVCYDGTSKTFFLHTEYYIQRETYYLLHT